MRGRQQLELTVRDFHTAQRLERERTLVQLLAELDRSHEADWYRWVLARRDGVHEHALRRPDGAPAACPVRGCGAVVVR